MAYGWPGNNPDPLQELCLNICAKHLETFAEEINNVYTLKQGIVLSKIICEGLLQVWRNKPELIEDKILHIFSDTTRTRLSNVNLSSTSVSIRGLEYIHWHPITDLDISFCSNIPEDVSLLSLINSKRDSLRTLRIENMPYLITYERFLELQNQQTGIDDSGSEEGYIFNCPNLRSLCLRNQHFCHGNMGEELFRSVLKPLKNLTHLDLFRSTLEAEWMESLQYCPSLLSLCLGEVEFINLQLVIQKICNNLRNLRHLDLSYSERPLVRYENPEEKLSFLAQNLPCLSSLDISGTNLAGFEKEELRVHHLKFPEKTEPNVNKACSIPGLEGKYLDFLGLLACEYKPCARENIPARRITGEANEEQILLSLQTYTERSNFVTYTLNVLYNHFRSFGVENQAVALEGILVCMKRHAKDNHVQISGSASLFYIVKGKQMEHVTVKQRRNIIDILLDAMENNSNELTMLRNGFLTLCHFDLPREVLYCYKRLVKVLLNAVIPEQNDQLVQRIAISLLNCLACQVDGSEKQMVGDLGAMDTMLELIRRKLNEKTCDETLEMAWSTMWNVTDETPPNCQRFMDGGGMDLFLECLKEFSHKPELLRNMMGLMGNIAEVQYLRARLMVSEYVTVFSELLNSTSDGIEVSYNAAGVLSHMASDGPEAWTIEKPERVFVLHQMVSAIERWKLETMRNINYRSFEPILQLSQKFRTPEAQHWAVWALCNLTLVYPEKYCSLLQKENGISILQNLISDPRPYPRIKHLAQMVIDNMQNRSKNLPPLMENLRRPEEEEDMEHEDEAGMAV